MGAIAEAVESYHPANNRSQVKISMNNTLICDSYNANPTSMTAALESFAYITAGSKAVVLGDMLELGEKSEEEHAKILNLLKSLNISSIFLVGPVFMKVTANSGISAFPDVSRLREYIKSKPLTGSTILIKGSRGIGLEKIYDLL
jgi:UDP-N-acetylmuramoyl-tripeptide--D-alanyl-D-alanine ligase